MRLDRFFLVMSIIIAPTLKTGFSINYIDLSVPGGYCGGATPLPIPNRVVKPSSADGTAPVAGWKSKSSPGLFSKGLTLISETFFILLRISDSSIFYLNA